MFFLNGSVWIAKLEVSTIGNATLAPELYEFQPSVIEPEVKKAK